MVGIGPEVKLSNCDNSFFYLLHYWNVYITILFSYARFYACVIRGRIKGGY